jgi:hypothetical protein
MEMIENIVNLLLRLESVYFLFSFSHLGPLTLVFTSFYIPVGCKEYAFIREVGMLMKRFQAICVKYGVKSSVFTVNSDTYTVKIEDLTPLYPFVGG